MAMPQISTVFMPYAPQEKIELLSSRQIIQSVIRDLLNQQICLNTDYSKLIGVSLYGEMRRQIEIRGIYYVGEKEINDSIAGITARISEFGNTLHIEVPMGTEEQMDNVLLSGYCSECGKYLPYKYNHSKEECDVFKAESVLIS